MSAYSRGDFANEPDVSRETLAMFDAWYGLLLKWNRKINLVSPTAMSGFWERHALDSWQVAAHMPETVSRAMDLGSGAGFPGIAVGIALKSRSRGGETGAETGGGRVTLVESAGKKATFLRTVARELDLPVSVTSERAENLPPKPVDLITARAFAPLPRLLSYAAPFWGQGTVGLFLKGEAVEAELEEAAKSFAFSTEMTASRSSEGGKLLAITDLVALDTDESGRSGTSWRTQLRS